MRKYGYSLTALFTLLFISCIASAQVIITVVGKGVEGYTGNGGPAIDCQIHWPEGIAIDAMNRKYIVDANNNVIRRIDDSGNIKTIIGSGFEAGTGLGGFSGDGGPATLARLYYPSGIAIDPIGNIYVADQRNHRVRKVDTFGVITTIAGTGLNGFSGDAGPAVAAALSHPTRVSLDAAGNIYIADSGNNRVRKIDNTGTITTVAGNGTRGSTGDGGVATNAQLFNPIDVVVDAAGNIYIADYVNNRIRKVDGTGNISTFAGIGIPGYSGDGAQATAANIYEPSSLLLDAAGNLYFSDLANSRVRKIDPSGIITTVAGNGTGAYSGDGGPATAAELWFPEGLAKDVRGQLYIADKANNRIRLVSGVLSVDPVSSLETTLNVFPNPSSGNFNVYVSSVQDEQVAVSVFSITGARILEQNIFSNKQTAFEIDVAPGIYFLSASSGHFRLNARVVIQ